MADTLSTGSESNDLQNKLECYENDLRDLFGLMLQIYSGGKGVYELGDYLLKAAQAHIDLNNSIVDIKDDGGYFWNACGKELEATKNALAVPDDMKRQRGFGAYDSFGNNKGRIGQLAAKIVAHKIFRHPGNGSQAEMSLMQTLQSVAEHYGWGRR